MREAGANGLGDLVKTVEFVAPAGAGTAYRQVGQVRERLLGRPFPASTGVVCAALLRPDWLIEVDATAVVPRRRCGPNRRGPGVNLLTPEVRACLGQTADFVAPEALGRASIRYFALALGDANPLWVDDAVRPRPRLARVSWRRRRSSARRASTPAAVRTATATWATPGGCRSPCRAGCCGAATRTASPHRPRPTPSSTSAGSSCRSKPSPPSSSPRPGGSTATSTASCWPRTTRRCSSGPSPTPLLRPAPAGTAPADHPLSPGVGEALPDLVRTLTLTDLVAYGAATWDWHRLHYDTAYASAAGLPGPIVDGQLWGALMATQVLDWTGPSGRLDSLAVRYRGVVTVGETVTLRAWADGDDLTQEVRAGDRLVATGTSRVSSRERG